MLESDMEEGVHLLHMKDGESVALTKPALKTGERVTILILYRQIEDKR